MRITLRTAWYDIHAAHTDYFTVDGPVHGHLWRFRVSKRQKDGEPLMDWRTLDTTCREVRDIFDHTNLGKCTTEHLAGKLFQQIDCDSIEVEEAGICSVVITK